jgi:Transglycosylase SLT domain
MTDFTDDDAAVWGQSDWARGSGISRSRRAARTGTRTRTHHVVRRSAPLPPLDRGEDAGFWPDDAWIPTLEPAQSRPSRDRGVGVDPRLLRLGVVAIAMVLMIPIALALRENGDGGEVRSQEPAAFASPSVPASPRAAEPLTRAERRARRAAFRTTTSAAAATEEEAATSAQLVAVPARAEPEPACAGEYTVVAGDFWVRFAESTDSDLGAWLRANNATVDTPLYAGDVLCVPEGASAPAPPPTVAPATTEGPVATEAPATTVPPTDAPTTPDAPPETPAPTTTAAPDTTAPATTAGPSVSPGGVEAIIRDIWPDELEERALLIAQRESSLQPDAYNGSCCYGLFQIYFDANRSFLASLGVTTPEQLLNARTNAMVAYAMYQRAGWSPWASTSY